MNSSKRKGDRAELEVEGILRDELGVPARRALGAGRLDDVGDIDGVPETCVQVAYWPSATLRAFREKPIECEQQRLRWHRTFGVTFIRSRGTRLVVPETAYPNWRTSQTIEQWAVMWREAH